MSPYKRLLPKITVQRTRALVKRLLIVTVHGLAFFLLLNWLFPLPDNIDYTTVITDRKGELLHAYLTRDQKWRMKTELSEISPLLRRTIVAKEDQYFYGHPGINPLAVLRAACNNLARGHRTSGASTITMQVARALERRPRTLGSKFVESFRALQLEWKYSKDEILQLYLNVVPYGGNIEGVKAASLLYFNKAPDHLSLAEITALSIIPNRPSSLVMGRHNDAIVRSRNEWLHRFADQKIFSNREIEDALAEPLTARRGTLPQAAPQFSWKLKSGAAATTVQSTLQPNTQSKVEKLTADYIRSLRLQNIRNAAVIVVDNQTRQVLAYVGSADFGDTSDAGQVNGAAAIRQPGSTLKPLLYGLCFDEGLLTPKTVLTDVPVNYGGYRPENYDQQFNGYVTVTYSLENSLNIPAVKSLNRLGTETMIAKLTDAGFRQVAKDRQKLGLSLILGGCGATLEELTGLFCAFANEGVYRPLRYRLTDSAGNSTRLLSPEATYLVTDILSQVARPDFPLSWSATEYLPKVAWKTGTSYGRRDAWSIGYNKRFTIGVWVGNFSGQGVPGLSGANTATPLLFRIFNTIDYNNDGAWFAPPKGLEQRLVCSESGLPPGPFCSNLVLDEFLPLVSGTSTCTHLQEVKVSPDASMSYCVACAPATGYIRKQYRAVPPEMQDFYAARNQPYARIPPHNPACEKLGGGDGPAITSPVNGTEYFLEKGDPEPLQLTARAANDVSRLYWYLNDRFYKSAAPGEKLFFLPESDGPLKITCTDDKGRVRTIRIEVKTAF
ncbi:penicillin-binding protein 1C [Flaviaesturariibacter aridisoli]|uniref:peptidoglycan glycosyltransferase n=1 Tax=Flaviaesturariibacter aridisoli TaxID=2545761 RepID=A0A4R4E0A8_9BACT|nr:penicillin-binding protein 1C [Flaviaesturariibacter aridisoli]